MMCTVDIIVQSTYRNRHHPHGCSPIAEVVQLWCIISCSTACIAWIIKVLVEYEEDFQNLKIKLNILNILK